jgi:hypothetical protein
VNENGLPRTVQYPRGITPARDSPKLSPPPILPSTPAPWITPASAAPGPP